MLCFVLWMLWYVSKKIVSLEILLSLKHIYKNKLYFDLDGPKTYEQKSSKQPQTILKNPNESRYNPANRSFSKTIINYWLTV